MKQRSISLSQTSVKDVHSFANPRSVQVVHLDLDLTVQFSSRTLSGHVTLMILRRDSECDRLILDTRDLSINEVLISNNGTHFKSTSFVVGDRDSILGSPLEISLDNHTSHVRIAYATSQNASALQWLDPGQTATGQYPFLFTQSQEIHARSWIPIQDSPSVRVTFTARIRTPKDLIAVMGARSIQESSVEEQFEFAMDQPVPSYLIALAVGRLEFMKTGPRTGVYAEPPLLMDAASEFSDTERMLTATETLYGPYQWGRFDLLILPPSFPFGGMENPRVPFITPTLIVGDKSLVTLVTHELAHSWSGNLVTNATWSDFWLNEGFTTYIEHRIQELLYGRERAEMEEALDIQVLQEDIGTLDPCDQVLNIDLEGRDPDRGGTSIPYVKGALFLRTLENIFGRERLDRFLRSYFDQFAFQSITTAQAIEYLKRELLSKFPIQARHFLIDEWVSAPGIPADVVGVKSRLLDEVEVATDTWLQRKVPVANLPAKTWSAQEWRYFVNLLPKNIGAKKLADLDAEFGLTEMRNFEIVSRWLIIAIQNHYDKAIPALERFLTTVGRRKYVKPIYSELMKTPKYKVIAKRIYDKARPMYHPITRRAVDEVLARGKDSAR
jgi:leukotriene-A4 hydrolase